MLKVIIKSIERKHILKDNEFDWIKRHVGHELRVSSISFDDDTGDVWCLVIGLDAPIEPDGPTIIVLFTDRLSNKIQYEFVGALPNRP